MCRALLALDLLYCALAATEEGLPGWHMFEAVDRIDYTLVDRDGAPIDVRAWLPKDAYVVDEDELRDVVAFVCEKEASRAPLTFDEPARGLRVTLAPGRCAPPRVRARR